MQKYYLKVKFKPLTFHGIKLKDYRKKDIVIRNESLSRKTLTFRG